MLIDIPNLPDQFDWKAVRMTLVQWFQRLQNNTAFVPPGTMAVFCAANPPAGWVKADNSAYDKKKFPELAKAIGTEISATQFRVPNAGAPPVGSIWMIKV